jgi:hypothetical protein
MSSREQCIIMLNLIILGLHMIFHMLIIRPLIMCSLHPQMLSSLTFISTLIIHLIEKIKVMKKIKIYT